MKQTALGLPHRPNDGLTYWIGLALILSWLVPHTVGSTTLFPIQLIATAAGRDLFALLAPAAGGSALCLLRWLPMGHRVRKYLVVAVGVAGALILVLPESNHLPFDRAILAVSILLTVGTAWGLRRRGTAAVQIAAAVLPAAALSVTAASMVAGGLSPAYVVALKTPGALFAFLLAAVRELAAGESAATQG